MPNPCHSLSSLTPKDLVVSSRFFWQDDPRKHCEEVRRGWKGRRASEGSMNERVPAAGNCSSSPVGASHWESVCSRDSHSPTRKLGNFRTNNRSHCSRFTFLTPLSGPTCGQRSWEVQRKPWSRETQEAFPPERGLTGGCLRAGCLSIAGTVTVCSTGRGVLESKAQCCPNAVISLV